MERSTKKELRALLELIRECYSIGDVENFKQRVLSRLAKIVRSNIRRYNELGPPLTRKYRANGTQRHCSASEAELLVHDIHKNPPCSHHRNNPEIVREHSSKPKGKFHRTLRLRQRAAGPPAKESKPNHGTRHFTKQPLTYHPSHGGQNARAETRMQQKFNALEHALNTFGLGLVVLTVHGKIRLATPCAIGQMRNYFGQEGLNTNHLPWALRSWVEQQQRALKRKDDVAPPENPLVLEHDEKASYDPICLRLRSTLATDAGAVGGGKMRFG